jgi:hypothetical protein
MKKLILITVIAGLLSCKKEDENIQPEPKQEEVTDFTGTWSGRWCNSYPMQLVITQNDSMIVINKNIMCWINGNTFQSDEKNGMIHSGILKDDILIYTESSKYGVCSTEFH